MDWKHSELFPAYEVSEFGDVRRCIPSKFGGIVGAPMSSYLKRGYRRFALWRGSKQIHVKAARLVIEAFIGPKPFEKAEVCHNDGSRENDHFTNLRWDTHAANVADKKIHGTTSRGEKHSRACLKGRPAKRKCRFLPLQDGGMG